MPVVSYLVISYTTIFLVHKTFKTLVSGLTE